MAEVSERIYLTVAQAAKRVKRSRRTIERWIAEDALPVEWWSNRRMVKTADLLTVFRSKLQAHWSPEQIARHLTVKYMPTESTHRHD